MFQYIYNNYSFNFNRSVYILVVLISIIVITSRDSIYQTPVTLSANYANHLGGSFSGNAYLSNDGSAFYNNTPGFNNSLNVSFANPQVMIPSIKINIGNPLNSTPISPLDYGANIIWYDGGYGAQNPVNNQIYPNVVNLTKSLGISVLRYPGGIPSDTFHWQIATGAQSSRYDNVVYQSRDVFLPSSFGPDEFGQFLQKTNAVGDITVNFGTGTALEAADWVQYMTAPAGSNYWGSLRAQNGHPLAYDIPFWEIGNEQQSSSGENYWRSGSVISINTNNCHSFDIHLCEYVYGGATEFSKQAALGVNNSLQGNGNPSQVFYIQYPPVATNSQTIYVNGKIWRQVDNIATAASNSAVYELDGLTGKISFGNGIHGEIVPNNANVTASYQSGPHDGFIQFYKLMKAADPNAQICSSYESIDFIKLMGSLLPYDCLASHLYAGNIPSTNDSALLFHNSLMQQSYGFANTISAEQRAIKQYAGSRAKDIHIDVTEYGVNARTYPLGQPNYHRSQDMALFVANTLKTIIDAHIPVAEKHFLISYENSQANNTQTYFNSLIFANNALIAGPGPDPILQPSAYALQAYSKLLYSNLISSNVQHNPNIIFSGGNYPALSVIATVNKNDNESLMVMNLSATNNITTEVQTLLSSYTHVNSWTLGASNFLAYNTPGNPTMVGFNKNSSVIYAGKFNATFPPSSITILQISK